MSQNNEKCRETLREIYKNEFVDENFDNLKNELKFRK